jgi:hypothetical protein
MNLLQIVQSACKRLSLPSPNSVIGSSDTTVIQLLELLTEEGRELARRYPWQALQNEATYTTLAADDQGAVETIAPGLNYIINDTIWNRTLRRPVFGPQTPQAWQQQKAFAINGPWSCYRIRGGHIIEYPDPLAGQNCYFEYVSRYFATDSSGANPAESFAADTDLVLLGDHLMALGLIWRFKATHGFDFQADFQKYETTFLDAAARDGGKDFLNLTNTKYDIWPGVIVPAGSWNL